MTLAGAAATPGSSSSADPDRAAAAPVVVVGVDGSAASQRALLFAAREAQLRRGPLVIVTAWEFDVTPGDDLLLEAPLGPAEEALQRAASELLATAADLVRAELARPTVQVRTRAVRGRPGRVLLDAAQGAALLVLGTRGAGTLSRLMMGSTSTEVVRHAHLPVTVVPSPPANAGVIA